MSRWIPVALISDCPEGECIERIVEGRVIALAHTLTGWYAVDGVCAHQGGPLGNGTLCQTLLTCPWHGWQFDVATGQNRLSSAVRQQVWEVRQDDEQVYVDFGEYPEG